MPTKVPLLDLQAQYESLRPALLEAIDRRLASGAWILGPAVEEFERTLGVDLRVSHAIGVASGTDALLLALKALRIGPGDEVVLPTYTFFATAGAVVNAGARPVFAEMEDDSFNLDPARLEECLTPRTRAVIAVHLFGQSARLDPILSLCRARGIAVIEDAAQAIGATYGETPVGGLGALGCFSFYPTKNLGGAGDGGLVTTQDDELADRVRLLRNHGMRPRYVHHEVGYNSRLDALQATILSVKLAHLESWNAARARHAERYSRLFAPMERIRPPSEIGLGRHVWNQYVIRLRDGNAERRDALRSHLAEHGIGAEIYYPIPLHLQPCFASLGHREGAFPLSEAAAATSLALPVFPEMTDEQQDHVVESIGAWLRA